MARGCMNGSSQSTEIVLLCAAAAVRRVSITISRVRQASTGIVQAFTTSVGHASRSSANVPRHTQAPIANRRSGMIVRIAIDTSPSSMPR